MRNFTLLPDEALLRLPELNSPNGPLPFRRTAFLELVSRGEAPAPALKQPRCTAWRWGDIRQWLDRLANREAV
jgi:predicted DNA-binding transcriptional regulator AlpA